MRAALVLATVAAIPSAFAIVSTTSLTDPGAADTLYSFVGQMNGSSAVAIGPNKVLTAWHVGGGSFVLNGTTYNYGGTTAAFNYVDPTDPAHLAHVDLRIVTVQGTLPGWYDIANGSTIGQELTMVGLGKSGVVSGDQRAYAVNFGETPGTRRKGDNTLDEKGVLYNSSATTNDGYGPYMLGYLKAAGDAVLAGNDSGGGWFSNGRLIGISSFTFNLTQPNATTSPAYRNYGFGSANTGGYTGDGFSLAPGEAYFGSGAIDLTDPQIQTWLRTQGVNPVPEPASMISLGIGAAALLRRRKRKQDR